MAKRQLNIQLDDETRDVLEAAVFVRDLRSMQELLRPTLEELAAKLSKEQRIQKAVELRSVERSQKSTGVTSIRSRRTKGKQVR